MLEMLCVSRDSAMINVANMRMKCCEVNCISACLRHIGVAEVV